MDDLLRTSGKLTCKKSIKQNNGLTCTGHNKLPFQTKDGVVHIKLKDDESGSFIGRHHSLKDSSGAF